MESTTVRGASNTGDGEDDDIMATAINKQSSSSLSQKSASVPPPSPSLPPPAAGTVDVQELLDFIFPGSLQHPLSTGRLYAFGMYGPLDENSNLRAGRHGQRVMSAWEIDTMCLQFEREDILQVRATYIQ